MEAEELPPELHDNDKQEYESGEDGDKEEGKGDSQKSLEG